MESFGFYGDGRDGQAHNTSGEIGRLDYDDFEIEIYRLKRQPPTKTYSRIRKDLNSGTETNSTKTSSSERIVTPYSSPSTSSSNSINKRRNESPIKIRIDDDVLVEEVRPNKIIKKANDDFPEIDTKSLDSLMPKRMLNDRVIEFYMNHLLVRAGKLQSRVHLFSTFFYCKLKQSYRTRESTTNQSIKRWDKNVKLFEKDFLILPICESAHWLMIIICYPRKVPTSGGVIVIDESTCDQNEPCLLIFDSLSFRYMTRFTDSIRNFLSIRWQYEKPGQEECLFSDRQAFKEYRVKVPKQQNCYDCGIYLLNSYENFMKSADETLNLIRDGKDFSKDWDVDTVHKRMYLKNLMIGT